MGSSKKTWDRSVIQIFLLSGKCFRRKEERIKQEYESSTQLGEGKGPGKWLPARKMFRQRQEESNVQSWGQQCKVFYMTELGIQRNPQRQHHPLNLLENAMAIGLVGSRGINSSIWVHVSHLRGLGSPWSEFQRPVAVPSPGAGFLCHSAGLCTTGLWDRSRDTAKGPHEIVYQFFLPFC